jgi:hypothetical protein
MGSYHTPMIADPTAGVSRPHVPSWSPLLHLAVALAALGSCQQRETGWRTGYGGLTPNDPRDTILEVEPDSIAYSGCSLGWKSVLGDSTVLVATVDLSRLRDTKIATQQAVLAPHIGVIHPGYQVQLHAHSGVVRLVFHTALDSTIDTTATSIVLVAVSESSRALDYLDTVKAALRACVHR